MSRKIKIDIELKKVIELQEFLPNKNKAHSNNDQHILIIFNITQLLI
jgi:hypothetical protein